MLININLNFFVLALIWALTIVMLILAIPRHQIREAMLIFMFKQVLTWLLGFIVVELGLLEYPVREFAYASRSSFSFEYFIFPAVCVVFNLRFPVGRSFTRRLLWYLFFPSWMSFIESMLEKHTRLVHYVHWTWYWTWISLLITFFLSRQFYIWFYRKGQDSSAKPADSAAKRQ
ncbi:CBO0543 family protein [Paenibacillus pinistramenti]|uniref:CBO0543 family protein n=1 Tax=Paenibacillus pinistramenti TaxID=1768003 RepID=UPI001109FEFC|nr:CBO0543 family protein [Paenibacillus pinistramenti]